MTAHPLAVLETGLVTSVGLSAPAALAAMRCGLSNPTETRFMNSAGNWMMGHAVPFSDPVRGLQKIARMAAMAAQESLAAWPRERWGEIPLLLCVAESARPGRIEDLDDALFADVTTLLGAAFAPASAVIAHGRVSAAVALLRARKALYDENAPAVLIVAADSLLDWPALREYDAQSRLLTENNSNGFIPGEAAAAVLVGRPARACELQIVGLGFATESATIEVEEPLRGEGLTRAILGALSDARCEMHELDLRLADISGEQYYFKEAALSLARTLRQRKEEFDLWHPAECIGEVGSAIGPVMIAVAEAAGRKGYAPGPGILIHAGNDAGQRAAIVARYVGS